MSTPLEIINETIAVGNAVHAAADEDAYGLWNDAVLKVLNVLFGQSSEQFLSFRFPSGRQGASSKEERIRNTIASKLEILDDVKQDLEAEKVDANIGWSHSAESLSEALDEVRKSLPSPDPAS